MRLCENFVSYLHNNDVIDEENKEIYEFGLKQTFSLVLDLGIAMSIGFFTKSILEMAIFMITFITIRRYAGGYHARRRSLCILFSMIMEITAILLISNYKDEFQILTVIAVIGIFSLSPIDTEERPLDSIEIQVYRNKALFLTTLWTLLFLIFVYFDISLFYEAIGIGIYSAFIMLVIGWIENSVNVEH